MKVIRLIFLMVLTVAAMFFFQHCKKDSGNTNEVNTNKLRSKTEWSVSSVTVPVNSATLASDWSDFKVSFTETQMTTSGFPTGAQAVWPSSSYTLNTDGTILTREIDGIVMQLNPITETNFTAIFTIDEGVELNGRIAALGGEYIFNMR